MVEVEPLWGICVIHGRSDRYFEPVKRVVTNSVDVVADAKGRSEGFVSPRRAGVLIVWVTAPLDGHGDCDYQGIE